MGMFGNSDREKHIAAIQQGGKGANNRNDEANRNDR